MKFLFYCAVATSLLTAKVYADPIKTVEKTVNRHIKTIACGASLGFPKAPQQVLPLVNDIPDRNMYLVPWQGDWRCYGGSGSFTGHIALVQTLKDVAAIVLESDILLSSAFTGSLLNQWVTSELKLINGRLAIKSTEGCPTASKSPCDRFYYLFRYKLTGDLQSFEFEKKVPYDSILP